MTSNLKNWVAIRTTSTYSVHSHLSTGALMSCASLNQLPPENSSNNFLRSRKTCGEVSSGQTVSTLPQSVSGGTGNRSNNTLLTKGRRGRRDHFNFDYSLRAVHPAIPRGLPRGC